MAPLYSEWSEPKVFLLGASATLAPWKLHYYYQGVTYDINLYADKNELNGPCLALRVDNNTTTVYAKLGTTGDLKATTLRVRKNGSTYAVLSEA